MREASVARRRRLLAYVDWVRGARRPLSALRVRPSKPRGAQVRGSTGRRRRPRARAPAPRRRGSGVAARRATRVMQMLRRQRPVHKSCRGFSTPSTRRLLDGVAHRQRRKQPPVAPNVADALARRGLGRLVASTIAPPVVPEVKKPPEDDSDLECGICLSLLTDPVHTPCSHVFAGRACKKGAEPGHKPPMSHLSRGRARGLDAAL